MFKTYWKDNKQMLNFDIQININIAADNELEAEKLIKEIMDEIILRENKLNSWDFVEYIIDES